MWVQECAGRLGVPNAFIGSVALGSGNLAGVLARYRDLPTVRAVRQPLYWAADPLKRLGARGDYLSDPAWLRDFERVAEAGFVWDLLVYDEQLPAAHDLIRSFPDTTFVLEAVGWPLDTTPRGFALWEERLRAASEFPNVVLKLQGIALIFGPSQDAISPWVRMALNIFGAGRCMFATHYPVDHLLWDIQTLVSTLRATLADRSAEEHAEFFGGTARRVYGLPTTAT
jgi:predicted TIM-barrel fold metal-dependent hydrolase